MERAQQSRERLTDRQREVLRLIERGHTNSEIAERLGISLQGAKWHVRELLGKFGVESREELIEAAAAGKSPFGRVSRWMSALAPAGLPKLSAAQLIGGLAATVAVGAAGVGFAVRFSGGPERETLAATPAGAVVAAVTPGPSPAAMPQVTGSVWTPEEALQHARQEVGADIGVSSYDAEFADRINLDDYVVTEFQWLPAASRYDLPDGDRYWQAEDGKPHDLWLVRYQGTAFDENPHSNQPVNVAVLALIEDGASAKVVKALAVDVTDVTGKPAGGGGSFRQRSVDAHMAAMTEPAGLQYVVARQNGLPDGKPLIVFRAKAGSWCKLAQSLECGFDPTRPSYPLIFGVSSGFNGRTGEGSTEVTVEADGRVARINVLPGDGRLVTLELADPPEGMPQRTRYAYLELGPSLPADRITIIAYDKAGKELGRRNGPGLGGP